MIFQLSKGKPDPKRPVESDTIKRWRDIAHTKQGSSDDASTEIPVNTATPVTQEPQLTPTSSSETVSSTPSWISELSQSFRKNEPVAPVAQPAKAVAPTRKILNEVQSALGPGTMIEGKLKFDAPVRIDGNLIGEVTSTSVLIVGEQAVVKAEVNVGSLVVQGHVSGKVQATDFIEIKSGGILEANVATGRLIIEEGGFFRGGCNQG